MPLRTYAIGVVVIFVVATGIVVGVTLAETQGGASINWTIIAVSVLGLLLLLATTLISYRRLVRPIEQISATIRGGAGRPHRTGPIEIGRAPREVLTLVEDINNLLEEVERDALTTSRLAALVESSEDSIIGKNLDGVITSWNAGATIMYGYTRDEMVGRNVSLLLPPDRVEELMLILQRISLGESIPAHETKRVRKDGAVLDVSAVISPIRDRAGVVIGASAVVRDITERKKREAERRSLEDRLNQSQRLESLGQLAGGVAHDFNNLIAVILNYASFVRDELASAMEHDGEGRWAAVESDMAQITLAAERASRLTRQLLAFAKRDVVRPEVLDLNRVVREMEPLLERTLGENIHISTMLKPALQRVMVDRGQIEQILVNLAVNARDAMPSGGRLTIETRNTEVDSNYATSRPGLGAGEYVELRLTDSGTGMSPEVAERVFEPFYTTKPKGEGTGLGLATIYGIVTQASGYVSLYSERGLGTTVTVLLPGTTAEPAPTVHLPKAGARGNGQTVLVVEDEDALREVSRRVLDGDGYQVVTAANGPEALANLGEMAGRLDLLLTDVVMPQMLGKELAERVVALHPETAVIFMSGYAEPLLDGRGSVGSNVTVLKKPFTKAELLKSVASAVVSRTAE